MNDRWMGGGWTMDGQVDGVRADLPCSKSTFPILRLDSSSPSAPTHAWLDPLANRPDRPPVGLKPKPFQVSDWWVVDMTPKALVAQVLTATMGRLHSH